MSEEFGPNFITLTDEDGNDIELEYIDALEHNGTTYMAFFPVVEEGEEENEDEYGLIILKSETVDGEEMLANVVDEDEINEVYDLFMEQMMEDEEALYKPTFRHTGRRYAPVVCRPPGCISRPDVGSSKTGQRRPTCNSCAGLAGTTRPTRGNFFAPSSLCTKIKRRFLCFIKALFTDFDEISIEIVPAFV